MEEKLITIKEVALKNNCPECYTTEGLKLTFKQKFIENRFYKSITNTTVEALECTKCNTIIYPERWTDDIENVFKYQKKAFTPKKPTIKFKRISWIILIAIDVIILGIILFVFFPEVLGLK